MSGEIWQEILNNATKKDDYQWYSLAKERGVDLLRPNDANNFSFHFAVRCNSKQIVTFYRRAFDPKELRLCCLRKDSEGVEPLVRAQREASKEMVNLIQPIIQDVDFGKNMEIVQEANLKVEANLEKYYSRVEEIKENYDKEMNETQKRIAELRAKQRELELQKEEAENLKNLKKKAQAKTRSPVVFMKDSRAREDYDHFFDLGKDPDEEEEKVEPETKKSETERMEFNSLLLQDNSLRSKEVNQMNSAQTNEGFVSRL